MFKPHLLHQFLNIAESVPKDLCLCLMEGQERIQHQTPKVILLIPDGAANAWLSSAGEVAQMCDVEKCSNSAAAAEHLSGVELFHF